MATRQNPLRMLLRLDEQLGLAPSAIDFNLAIPESLEKAREANVLAGADARAGASLNRDLEEANAVREARNLGFEGSYPLREQADYTAAQKLQTLLAPLLAREAADQDRQAFAAQENERNRAAAMERANLGQQGQDRRSAENRAAAIAMAKATGRIPGPGILDSLFGGGEEDMTPAPASVAPAGGKYKITVE